MYQKGPRHGSPHKGHNRTCPPGN